MTTCNAFFCFFLVNFVMHRSWSPESLVSLKFAGSDGEQVQFAEDFEKLADLEKFLEHQDQLHLEEAARELLDVDIEDDRTFRHS